MGGAWRNIPSLLLVRKGQQQIPVLHPGPGFPCAGRAGRGQPTVAVAAGFVGIYVRKEKVLRHVTAFFSLYSHHHHL